MGRTNIAACQANPQRIDIARACLLSAQQCPKHERQSNDPGAPMAFNRIEYGIGIKTLKQDERYAKPNTGQHSEKPTAVDHRAKQRGDLVPIETPVFKWLGSF